MVANRRSRAGSSPSSSIVAIACFTMAGVITAVVRL